MDDRELARRIAEGDLGAEKILIERFYKGINAIVHRRLQRNTPEDRQNVISNVLYGILKSLREGKYNPEKQRMSAYIQGTVNNKIKEFFAKRTIERKYFEADGMPDDPVLPVITDSLKQLVQAEASINVRRCLSRLSDRYRQVLLLVYYENLPVKEIAEMMRISAQVVSNLKSYGLKLLQNCLKKFEKI